jgi:hypothetical protein
MAKNEKNIQPFFCYRLPFSEMLIIILNQLNILISIQYFYICIIMKTIARLLLFLFLSFLITPTVVCVIEKNADVSLFYSFSEEEKTQKEIKAVNFIDIEITSIDLSQLNCKIIFSENLSKHDHISSTIYIPPPEQA